MAFSESSTSANAKLSVPGRFSTWTPRMRPDLVTSSTAALL